MESCGGWRLTEETEPYPCKPHLCRSFNESCPPWLFEWNCAQEDEPEDSAGSFAFKEQARHYFPYHCSPWDEAWPLSFYTWHCWDEPEPTLGPYAMWCMFCGKYGDESTLDAVSGDGWGCVPCVDGYQRGD